MAESYSSNLLVNGSAEYGSTSEWTTTGVTVQEVEGRNYFFLDRSATMSQLIDSLAFVTQPQMCLFRIKGRFLQVPTRNAFTVQALVRIAMIYNDGTSSQVTVPLTGQFIDTEAIGSYVFWEIERECTVSTNQILQQVQVTVITSGMAGPCYITGMELRRSVSDVEIHELNSSPHQLPLNITVGQFGIKGVTGEKIDFWLKSSSAGGGAIFGGELQAATGTIGTAAGKQLIVNSAGEVTLPALTITGLADHPSIQSIATEVTAVDGKVTQVSSLLTQTASEIRTEMGQSVTALQGQITQANSRITQTADSLTAEIIKTQQDLQNNINTTSSLISQTATEIRSEVSALGGTVDSNYTTLSSAISQTAGQIWLKVDDASKGNDIISEINLDGTTIKIAAEKLDIEGAVTFSSLSTEVYSTITSGGEAGELVEQWKMDGTTNIDGANIETGTIIAAKIKAGELIVGTNVTMGTDARIKWTQVTDAGGNPATATTVGARSSTWMPTASDVGARSASWLPTPADIGAMTMSQFSTEIGRDYIVTGKINANQITAGTLTGFIIQTAPTGNERLVMNENCLAGFDSYNRYHGIVIESGNMGEVQFYYQGNYRGKLGQLGGSVYLESEYSLCLGKQNSSIPTIIRGAVDFSQASGITWGNNTPTGSTIAVFG